MKTLLAVTALLLTHLSAAAQIPQGSLAERRDSYEKTTTARGAAVSGKVIDKSGKSQVGLSRHVMLSPVGSAVVTPGSEGTTPRASGGALKTSVGADGRFEFPAVRPGSYMLRVDPYAPGARTLKVDVLTDLRNIELVIPFQVEVAGRVVLGGRTLGPNATVQALQPAFTSGTGIHDDGTFKLLLVEGENQLSVARLPAQFRVQKITFGSTDITNAPLNVNASMTPHEIVVTLETIPDAVPAVTTSGRNR